ncbi:MAG: class I SAM-dependent methyltransferase [Parcubacteria group bacterium]|jgi:SAM-dependent methyltransferase
MSREIKNRDSVKKKYIKYLNTVHGAKKYNDYKKILYGRPDSLVIELFRRIYPNIKDQKSLKILDVGGGDGKRLKLLFDLLSKKGIDASATLVEPSSAFVTELKKSLKSAKKYNIRVAKRKFEDYFEKGEYDLILFIHSIFTFKGSVYLQKAKKMLAKNGLLIVMSNDPKSFIAGLKKITDAKFRSERKEIGSVLRDLINHGFKHKIEKFDTIFRDATKDDKISASGKKILEWISLSDYKDISGNIKSKALSYFKGKTINNQVKEKEILIKSRQ